MINKQPFITGYYWDLNRFKQDLTMIYVIWQIPIFETKDLQDFQGFNIL